MSLTQCTKALCGSAYVDYNSYKAVGLPDGWFVAQMVNEYCWMLMHHKGMVVRYLDNSHPFQLAAAPLPDLIYSGEVLRCNDTGLLLAAPSLKTQERIPEEALYMPQDVWMERIGEKMTAERNPGKWLHGKTWDPVPSNAGMLAVHDGKYWISTQSNLRGASFKEMGVPSTYPGSAVISMPSYPTMVNAKLEVAYLDGFNAFCVRMTPVGDDEKTVFIAPAMYEKTGTESMLCLFGDVTMDVSIPAAKECTITPSAKTLTPAVAARPAPRAPAKSKAPKAPPAPVAETAPMEAPVDVATLVEAPVAAVPVTSPVESATPTAPVNPEPPVVYSTQAADAPVEKPTVEVPPPVEEQPGTLEIPATSLLSKQDVQLLPPAEMMELLHESTKLLQQFGRNQQTMARGVTMAMARMTKEAAMPKAPADYEAVKKENAELKREVETLKRKWEQLGTLVSGVTK